MHRGYEQFTEVENGMANKEVFIDNQGNDKVAFLHIKLKKCNSDITR